MAATVLDGLDEVRAAVGCHLGQSDWVVLDGERIEGFERAVGGRPLSDPYLVLSLSNLFLPQIVEVRGVAMGVNYGCDRVRFPAPAGVGSRLRAGADLVAVAEVAGGVQILMRITVEAEGTDEPVCVIDSLSRWTAPPV